MKLLLSGNFTRIDTLRNPNLLISALEKTSYDLILLDMNFKTGQVTGNEGIFWMNKIREKDPELTVVFITAYGDVELAVKSMKEGASDFIMKSWDEQKILSTVLSAFELGKKNKEIGLLKKKQAHLAGELEKEKLVCRCQSPAMKEITEMVRKVALTRCERSYPGREWNRQGGGCTGDPPAFKQEPGDPCQGGPGGTA